MEFKGFKVENVGVAGGSFEKYEAKVSLSNASVVLTHSKSCSTAAAL